jgi:Phage tail protein (Tail_P2_I).
MNLDSAFVLPPYFREAFRKTLRWPFLLVGGPIACVCEGVARAADDVLKDIKWFVDQFNPATCEPEYVDRHGKARGLVRHYKESAEQWRRRVCAAYAWHKLAGRQTGIPKILARYGYEGAVLFNRALEGEPELWAHFRIEFGGGYPITDEDYEIILWMLGQVKPAKSILESMTLVLKPKVTLHVAIGMVCGQVTTIMPYQPPSRKALTRAFAALGWQAWTTTTIGTRAAETRR